jgi:hypothetical protein
MNEKYITTQEQQDKNRGEIQRAWIAGLEALRKNRMRLVLITSSKFDEIFNVYTVILCLWAKVPNLLSRLRPLRMICLGTVGQQSRIWLHTMGHSADQALDKIQTVSHVYMHKHLSYVSSCTWPCVNVVMVVRHGCVSTCLCIYFHVPQMNLPN